MDKPAALVSGAAYVWVKDQDKLPIALLHELRLKAMFMLAKNQLFAELNGYPIHLGGVVFGQKVEEEFKPGGLTVPGWSMPVLQTYAVAGEGRFPGVYSEFGLFAETAHNRKWLCSFGIESLEFWRVALGVPPFYRRAAGVIQFTTTGNRARVRREFFEQRKAADKKWKS